MLPFRDRVDLGVMAMKGYSAFPKAPALLELHHQIVLYHIQDTRLTLLQRCSWCTLQPQLTGQNSCLAFRRYDNIHSINFSALVTNQNYSREFGNVKRTYSITKASCRFQGWGEVIFNAASFIPVLWGEMRNRPNRYLLVTVCWLKRRQDLFIGISFP